ncbi:transport complex subunit Cog4 [Schizosaccharomyces cryophilus OY26]|uniref:Conserved oligomeric Golgi complex subunit 4 n=1 Tax=Schizosaccharomyces cryophilus (strain OY26 / ATCC MYA-4695 / CBS 11777 / NBRC 106824 / NRRL Y48691) TaxID=653667 RepID=S9VWR1_SCHCR|nr:transport complex subunit Cog4 [Schizosaccharomyces cryophilus OY26]EPY52088.1 transport complex subunit Cog4 [Schizosaccharomyces cryophilus OY26]
MTNISICECTSINQIEASFHSLQEESKQTDDQLQSLLDSREPIENYKSTFKTLAERLILLVNQIDELKHEFCDIPIVDQQVINKIKVVDREQNRLKECLLYVRQVRDFKECLIELNRAMQRQHWEKAADFVHRANCTSSSIIQGKFALAVVPTSEQPLAPTETLHEVIESLHALFQREFQKAARDKDQKEITRYFKLFPLIGKEKEGLESYWHFFGGIIASKARATLDEPSSHSFFFSQAFTGLVEHVASIVRAHTPLVLRYYKAKNTITVIENLQYDCDRQGSIIISTMYDVRRITSLLNSIKNYKFLLLNAKIKHRNLPSDQHEMERVSLQNLHPLLSEITSIITKWNMYKVFISRFIHRLLNPDPSTLKSPDERSFECANVFLSSKVEQDISNQLIPSLLHLETYYLKHSMETAFELEEHYTRVVPWTSSIVDDVMYVTKQVVQRIFFSGSSAYLDKFIRENLCQIFQSIYYVYISSNLTNLCGIIRGQFQKFKDAGKIQKSLYERFVVLTNSASLSKEYLCTVLDEISKKDNEVYPFSKDKEQVITTLDKFRKDSNIFDKLCSYAFNTYFPIFMLPKIEKSIDDVFMDCEYVLSYDDYTQELARERSLVSRLRVIWNRITAFEEFTPKNQFILTRMACEKAASYLEHLVLYKIQWNEYGAMALENDLSQCIHVLSKEQVQLRDNFERLQELLLLLVWESESASPAQVTEDLNLRLLSLDIVAAIQEKKKELETNEE